MAGHFTSPWTPSWRGVASVVTLVVIAGVLVGMNPAAQATSSDDPYAVPLVVDTNPDPNIVETTIVAQEATVDVGGGVMANMLTFNGTIPGPEFRLEVGNTVIVHFENQLSEVTGIHWHGIELANAVDGTALTQNQVEPGGTFLYQFQVTRPGVFWYHPHHHSSTNQVFQGLYGSIIVTDPYESQLIASGALPPLSQTHTLALSDVTVCKTPGSNDAATYDPSLPWVGGAALPNQAPPTPVSLCESPFDDHGDPIVDGNGDPVPLVAGDVPNIQRAGTSGRVNEGQTVLTNGMNVGGRGGAPDAPGALDPGASTLEVAPGQGLRLRIGNAAAIRFFRLLLTDSTGNQIPLIRVGGQGGLLDQAVLDGGIAPGGFDFKYGSGEILLDPGERADVVAVIPPGASGVATLWTQDFSRTGAGFSGIPTVPVAHFDIAGPAGSYAITDGTPLRASIPGAAQEVLGPATNTLLDPATFSPAKAGSADPDIQLTASGSALGINGVPGEHDFPGPYTGAPHLDSTRYATLGDTLELTVTNATPGAHHPFHLHGFSIQPIAYEKPGGPDYTFPYREFVDNIDVPPGYTLRFRVHLEDRPLMDGTTPGGGLGRWVFHCHIFHHAVFGMISEFVVVAPDGNERPYVNADDTVSEAARLETATMTGTYHDPDGDAVTLVASVGTVIDNGGGTWSWDYLVPSNAPSSQTVYITATDATGLTDQAAFTLEVTNTPPTVTIDPDQVTVIDEGGTVTVTADFTDPDVGDTHTATIDWGVPAGHEGVEVVAPALQILDPGGPTDPIQGQVTGAYRYGDNDDGTGFVITVTVTDSADATGSDSVALTVTNLDPIVTIDTSGAVLLNGIPTIVTGIGDEVAFSGDADDPGSDDLTLSWDWDDGSFDSRVSLVNPPDVDPLPSPTVQPRSEPDQVEHTFGESCLYAVTFSADDDDGGSAAASVAVVVTGDADTVRSSGYWSSEYRGTKQPDFTASALQCYLDIVNHVSAVFSEARPLVTFDDAAGVLKTSGSSSAHELLDAQLLAAWLNFANGAYALDDLVPTTKKKAPDTPYLDVLVGAEMLRLDPTASTKDLLAAKDVLDRLNSVK